MDKLLEILHELRPELDYAHNDSLIDGGHLDSFDIVTLVGELNDAFDIEIGVEDLIPENFNSVAAMWSLIQRLREQV
ncbi:MAG: acyl carrier protein [Chloroflexi bacterium]|nr:acyl carrier protein [Chloroflexota bacterium]